jgi:hypothetical protein
MSGTRADATLYVRGDTRGVDAALGRTEGRVSGLASRLNTGAGGMARFNTGLKTGQERVEKLATATTGLSSVMGGLGSKVGAAFGALSNLAMAGLAGGPALVALVGLATAGAALATEISEIRTEAAALDRILPGLGSSLSQHLDQSIKDTKKSLSDLQEELRNFGKTTLEIQRDDAMARADIGTRAIGSAQRRVATGRETIAGLEGQLALAERAGVSGRAERLREQIETERQIVGVLETRIAKREIEVELASDLAIKTQELIDKREAERLASAGGGGGGGRRPSGPALEGGSSEDFALGNAAFLERMRREAAAEGRRRDEEAAKLREEQLADEQSAAEKRVQLKKEEEKEKERLAKERLRAEEEATRRHYVVLSRMASEAIGFVANVTQTVMMQTLDIIEQVSAGQQVEFDKIAAAFVRNIGTQIAGIGIRFAAEGAGWVASALIPGQQGNLPGGLAMIGVGSSIAAAGFGMAAGGAVYQGMSSRFAPGGGGGGSSIPTSASIAPDRAAPPTADDRGPTNITIVNNAPVYDLNRAARHFTNVGERRRELLEEATA